MKPRYSNSFGRRVRCKQKSVACIAKRAILMLVQTNEISIVVLTPIGMRSRKLDFAQTFSVSVAVDCSEFSNASLACYKYRWY